MTREQAIRFLDELASASEGFQLTWEEAGADYGQPAVDDVLNALGIDYGEYRAALDDARRPDRESGLEFADEPKPE